MNWILTLQAKLISAACQPDIKGKNINKDWVVQCGVSIGGNPVWLENISNCKDTLKGSKKTVLEHLTMVADLADEIKKDIWNSLRNDLTVDRGFNPSKEYSFALSNSLKSAHPAIWFKLRGFFESFYEPTFNKKNGYDVPDNGKFISFNRSHLLDNFDRDNVKVCPLCDGQLGTPQVDHWIPKSKFPFLSCHPRNLVPICSSCNKEKLAKLPLDEALHPFAHWFHPYYRNLDRGIQVCFQTAPHSGIVLKSKNPLNQKRVDNLVSLVDLEIRWQKELENYVQFTIKMIRNSEVRKSLNINIEDTHSQLRTKLRTKLRQWATERDDAQGLIPFAILHHQYLLNAESESSETFEELFIALVEAMSKWQVDALSGEHLPNGGREVTSPLLDSLLSQPWLPSRAGS